MLIITTISRRTSPKSAVTRPVIRPRHPQVAAQQDVRVISRLFILDAVGICIFRGDRTVFKQLLSLVQIEAGNDYGLWLARIVSTIPKRIGQAHSMWQTQRRSVQ